MCVCVSPVQSNSILSQPASLFIRVSRCWPGGAAITATSAIESVRFNIGLIQNWERFNAHINQTEKKRHINIDNKFKRWVKRVHETIGSSVQRH